MSYEMEKPSFPDPKEDWKQAFEDDYQKLFDEKYEVEKKLKDARRIIADFVCSNLSYMLVNNLGDPFKQQDVRRAVKFLLEDE